MMKMVLGAVSVVAVLAACDKRDTLGDVEDVAAGGTTQVLGNVTSGELNDGALTVAVPLDATGNPAITEYAATAPLNGYLRFEQQASDINRAFTAVAGESPDGNLVAVVTMDGGQFNRFLGGASLEQRELTTPSGGLVYFNGAYAGLHNIGPSLSTAAGAPDAITPDTTGDVTGQVFLVADFTDNQVEGAIYNRATTFANLEAVLPEDLVLIQTDISEEGTFSGSIEIDSGLTATGSYNGAFGGTQAAYAGGITSISNTAYVGARDANPIPIPADATEEQISAITAENARRQAAITGAASVATLQEYGLFIIGQCSATDQTCFGASQ